MGSTVRAALARAGSGSSPGIAPRYDATRLHATPAPHQPAARRGATAGCSSPPRRSTRWRWASRPSRCPGSSSTAAGRRARRVSSRRWPSCRTCCSASWRASSATASRGGSCCSVRTRCRRWPRSSSRCGRFEAGTPPIGIVLAAAFVIGTCRVFADAAAFGAVSCIVGRAHFTEGQAMLSAAWSIGLVAGPAAGGALIAAIGAGEALVIEFAAFVLAAAAAPAACATASPRARDRPRERLGEALLRGPAGHRQRADHQGVLRHVVGVEHRRGRRADAARAAAQGRDRPLERRGGLGARDRRGDGRGGGAAGRAAQPALRRRDDRALGHA